MWGRKIVSWVIFIILVACLTGCAEVMRRVTPPTAEFVEETPLVGVDGVAVVYPDGTPAMAKQRTTVTGAGARGAIDGFKAGVVQAGPQGGKSKKTTMAFFQPGSAGFATLYILGGLLIAGGIVVVAYLKQTTLGLAMAGAGMAVIAAAVLFENYPWVVLIPVAGLLGYGGYMLYRVVKGDKAKVVVETDLNRVHQALAAVVAAIASLPSAVAKAVKRNVSVAAATTDPGAIKNTISEIKAEVGAGNLEAEAIGDEALP